MPVLVKRTGFYKARTKGKSKPIQALRKHMKYIEAQREKHRNQVVLFDKHGNQVNRNDFMEKIKAQKNVGVVGHKLVFSLSEDEAKRYGVDMRELVRETMIQYEQKHKTQLDWVGAFHDDEKHPHCHIVVRGRDEAGKSVYIGTDHMRQMERFGERTKERLGERYKERGIIEKEQDRDELSFLRELEEEREHSPFVQAKEIEKSRDWDMSR